MIKKMSDRELVSEAKRLNQIENAHELEVLQILKQIEDRKAFAEVGFESLYSFCIKELKYDEPKACRRISAARLLREIPEIEASIAEGALSLTAANYAQTFFRQVKALDQERSVEEKKEVLRSLENKTTREIQVHLADLNPEACPKKREGSKPISKTQTQMLLILDNDIYAELTQLKDLLAQRMLNANKAVNFSSLVGILAKEGLKKHDPACKALHSEKRKEKAAKNSNLVVNPQKTSENIPISEPVDNVPSAPTGQSYQKNETFAELSFAHFAPKMGIPSNPLPVQSRDFDAIALSAQKGIFNHLDNPVTGSVVTDSSIEEPTAVSGSNVSAQSHSRYIPAPHRHHVWVRDKGRCTFVDPLTGEVCQSKHRVQFDHIVPFALGGTHAVDNLRLRCATHNSWQAAQVFGSWPKSKLSVSGSKNKGE